MSGETQVAGVRDAVKAELTSLLYAHVEPGDVSWYDVGVHLDRILALQREAVDPEYLHQPQDCDGCITADVTVAGAALVLCQACNARRLADPTWRPKADAAFVDQRTDSDCWISCLASLTGLQVEGFPQPPAIDHWEKYGIEYGNLVRRHLIDHGWLLVKTWTHAPAGYAIANGPSPRSHDWGHAVIALGGHVVHDPHPSRAGVAGEIEEYEVLIPLANRTEPALATTGAGDPRHAADREPR